MKIGLSLGYGVTPAQICVAGVEADLHGFHSVWLAETQGAEAMSILGALSQLTHTVRLSTGIVNIYSRSAALTAMAAATVDNLSKGRFILAIGASTKSIVEGWHSTRFEYPLQRIEDYVKAIKTFLRDGGSSYEGSIIRIHGFETKVKPLQENLPIFVAAVNNAMIQVATSLADGVLFFLRPIDAVRNASSQIRLTSSQSSSKPVDVACSIVTCASRDAKEAETQARRTVSYYVSVGSYYRTLLQNYGYSEVEEISREWLAGRREEAAAMVSRRLLDAVSIYGPAKECKNSLQRFVDAGASLLILQYNIVGGDFEESLRETAKIPEI
ncbi:MAG: LLM class flavin-dependent oxidoreductase [Thaumarchaeota archaeon]|nr:LLM class flavin-dependent oxidoreductase [Nitrososphaerota archaeon]